jgi:hypothetical protein
VRLFGRRKRQPDAAPTYWNSAVVERIQRDAGVDRDTAAALWAELLLFLDLVAESKEFVSPPPGVDIAWHAFILHTRDYEAYCRERYGRIIHHQPTGAPDPSAYRRAYERRSANRTPVDHTIWPLPSSGAPHRDDDGPSRPGQSGDFAAGVATIGGGDFGGAGSGERGDFGGESGAQSGDFEDGPGGQAGGDFGDGDVGGGDFGGGDSGGGDSGGSDSGSSGDSGGGSSCGGGGCGGGGN